MPLNPSLVKDNLQFYSQLNIDKIVRVFEGSYDAATDVSTRVGDLSTAYIYTIKHGLTRPVFCELLTSIDGGTTYQDGGSASGKLAFSDSTNVYIFDSLGVSGSGTVLYKVICSWIDSYDSTNPSVESVMYRDKPLALDSRVNYQKIYDQNTLDFSGTGSQTVIHTLGYIPNAKAFFESVSGEVWPLNFGGASNPFLYDSSQPEAYMIIQNDNISVTLELGSGYPRRVWYRIYYDD